MIRTFHTKRDGAFFESGDTGFFATVAGMLVLGLGMLLIGFRRKWF